MPDGTLSTNPIEALLDVVDKMHGCKTWPFVGDYRPVAKVENSLCFGTFDNRGSTNAAVTHDMVFGDSSPIGGHEICCHSPIIAGANANIL